MAFAEEGSSIYKKGRVTKREYIFLFVVEALFISSKFLLSYTNFFWDSVQIISVPSTILYNCNFSSFLMPPDVVNDNLPLNSLIAFLWSVFGRNMFVTHIFFGLVGVFLIYHIFRLCRLFATSKKALICIFLLVISDTSLVTQSLIISFDSVLLLFFVMSLRYVIEKRTVALAISLFFLALLRSRGMLVCAGMGLAYFIINYIDFVDNSIGSTYINNWVKTVKTNIRVFFKVLFKSVLPFLPALAGFTALYVFQNLIGDETFVKKGESFLAIGDAAYIIKNTGAIVRFFLDHAKIFIYICLFILLFKFGFKRVFTKAIAPVYIMFIGVMFVLIISTAPFHNPCGSRYYISGYIMLSLFVGYSLFNLLKEKQAVVISVVLIIGLWSGHLWRYPETLSVSWDSSLSHLPYYELREETLTFINENNIPYDSTGSFYPAMFSSYMLDLGSDSRSFDSLDLNSNNFVVYSNIGNWKDGDIYTVKNNWILLSEFKKGAVFIKVYKRV